MTQYNMLFDWFKIGKGVCQGCTLSPYLIYKWIEYFMQCLAGWAQAGIKTPGRNNNILRYAGDTTLMTESEDERKSLLMRVKEESGKAGLKLII